MKLVLIILRQISSEAGMDTSMHNLAKPNTLPPLPVSNDVDMEQTDAYSDDGMIADTDIETQIPANNDETIEAGNNTVETLTDSTENPKMTEPQTEVTKQSIVLKLQPLSDIDIDIWSNKVVQYHQFKADTTTEPPKTENNAAPVGYIPDLNAPNQQNT